MKTFAKAKGWTMALSAAVLLSLLRVRPILLRGTRRLQRKHVRRRSSNARSHLRRRSDRKSNASTTRKNLQLSLSQSRPLKRSPSDPTAHGWDRGLFRHSTCPSVAAGKPRVAWARQGSPAAEMRRASQPRDQNFVWNLPSTETPPSGSREALTDQRLLIW